MLIQVYTKAKIPLRNRHQAMKDKNKKQVMLRGEHLQEGEG
jgi:hypothetical protein